MVVTQSLRKELDRDIKMEFEEIWRVIGTFLIFIMELVLREKNLPTLNNLYTFILCYLLYANYGTINQLSKEKNFELPEKYSSRSD